MSDSSSKNTVFVLKNQQGLYLTKQQEWVDGSDAHVLYRTRHRDEATNTIFEASLRDIHLRAETVVCELDAKNNPVLATAETLTPARAAQIARQQDLDIEEETPAAPEEALDADDTAPAADATDAAATDDTTPAIEPPVDDAESRLET